MKDHKVMVAIPSMEMVHADFAISLAALVAYTVGLPGGPNINVINKQRSRIEVNRFGLVQMAKSFGATHILFIDSDMTFPPDTLIRLLKPELRVIGCNAARRTDPPTAIIPVGDGIQQVDHLGLGVMLIDMEVFKHLEVPYFKAVWDESEERFIGEDIYFCRQVRAAGGYVYCNHGLSELIGHVGARNYKLADCTDE